MSCLSSPSTLSSLARLGWLPCLSCHSCLSCLDVLIGMTCQSWEIVLRGGSVDGRSLRKGVCVKRGEMERDWLGGGWCRVGSKTGWRGGGGMRGWMTEQEAALTTGVNADRPFPDLAEGLRRLRGTRECFDLVFKL
eukprot:GHVN01053706.1.p1 GENE.GHVN01053706.1~~GHVN01053706.1.p1  ORF type:complete len:136 (-),score=22.58 GHVN01053706.1:559-966(-)